MKSFLPLIVFVMIGSFGLAYHYASMRDLFVVSYRFVDAKNNTGFGYRTFERRDFKNWAFVDSLKAQSGYTIVIISISEYPTY